LDLYVLLALALSPHHREELCPSLNKLWNQIIKILLNDKIEKV
jgi:hypothetical protein